MADYASYSSQYGPTMPSSQGPQGQQGASQQQNPQDYTTQYRSSLWTPPPSSTQQPAAGQQGQKAQVPQSQGMQNAATGSPVTSNGMIAPGGAPSAQNAPPAQTQGQPQSQSSTPAMWGVNDVTNGTLAIDPARGWSNQQWADWYNTNHPRQAAATPTAPQQGQQPAAPTGAQPNPALYSPYGPYPGRTDNTTYQPGQVPQYNFQPYQTNTFTPIQPMQMPTYQAGNITQFNAPDQSGLNGQQSALIQQLMSNPGWGADAVNQMKAGQKDSALAMQQQQQQQLQQAAAGRGMLNSGFELGNERRLGDATQQNILNAYRGIDVANAQNTFQNQLAAAQAAEQALTGQANRASQFYTTGLQGQQAQEALRQAQAQSGQNASQFALQQALANFGVQQAQAGENQQAFQNQFAAPAFQQQAFLAQQGLNQQGAQSGLAAYNSDINAWQQYQNNLNSQRQLDIQSQLGNAGIGVDQQRLQEQGREFNSNNQLNWAQLLNDMYMGRSNLGLNYAQLQNTAQNQMFAQLFGNMLGS